MADASLKDTELVKALTASAKLLAHQDTVIQQQMTLIKMLETHLNDNNLGNLLTKQIKPKASGAGTKPIPSQVKYGPVIGSKSPVQWTGTTEDFIPVSIDGERFQAMILSEQTMKFWQESIRAERQKKKYRQQALIEWVEVIKYEERYVAYEDEYRIQGMADQPIPKDGDGWKSELLRVAHQDLAVELAEWISCVNEHEVHTFYKQVRAMNQLLEQNAIVTEESDGWVEQLKDLVDGRLNHVPVVDVALLPEPLAVECEPFVEEFDEIEAADLSDPNYRDGSLPAPNEEPYGDVSSTESSPKKTDTR